MIIGHEQNPRQLEISTGTLGMYLFLASEAMFFVGILGSFVVLESAGGQHELFVQSSLVLSKWIGVFSAGFLIFTSVMIARWFAIPAGYALLSAFFFLSLQYLQWHLLLRHPADGPSGNNFFACYFLFTSVHVVHLIVGMIAVLWFTIRPGRHRSLEHLRDRRGDGLPPSVQIYWHFVNAVGVAGLATLYFV